MVTRRGWIPKSVDLRGIPEDFGLAMELGEDEVLTTGILAERYGVIPGTRDARDYWDAVESNANESGWYGGKRIEFGVGGLSALIHDRMVLYYGMQEGTAVLMTKVMYLIRGGVEW